MHRFQLNYAFIIFTFTNIWLTLSHAFESTLRTPYVSHQINADQAVLTKSSNINISWAECFWVTLIKLIRANYTDCLIYSHLVKDERLCVSAVPYKHSGYDAHRIIMHQHIFTPDKKLRQWNNYNRNKNEHNDNHW